MINASRIAVTATVGLVLCCPVATQDEQKTKPQEQVKVASFGMSTRAPSTEEVAQLDLKMQVKIQGQIVSEVAEDGAAAKAGIQKGDAILKLDKNGIFSQDDIADFLQVSKPDQKVTVQVVRAKNSEEETLSVSLGSESVAASTAPRLEWEFASLGQLDAALARAKKQGTLLFVGLSGAET
jgi:C-terminal processing protease CtpA/Prc